MFSTTNHLLLRTICPFPSLLFPSLLSSALLYSFSPLLLLLLLLLFNGNIFVFASHQLDSLVLHNRIIVIVVIRHLSRQERYSGNLVRKVPQKSKTQNRSSCSPDDENIDQISRQIEKDDLLITFHRCVRDRHNKGQEDGQHQR